MNQLISALQYLYEHVLDQPLRSNQLPRPMKQRKLPTILDETEVKQILNTVRNRKHRLILLLIYSAGLRLGEVVQLKPTDADTERMLILI